MRRRPVLAPAEGATFLVTGGAGGIGRAVLGALRDAGWSAVGADMTGTDADITLDVTDPAAVDAAVSELAARPGGLGGVVVAAGIGVGGPMHALDLDDWRRAIDVNLWGSVHAVRAAYPRLVAQGRGHIVLLASLSGLVPTPLLVPYATTKWAVVGMARSLAPEARRHGVGVTAICPGPVDTPLLDAARAHDPRTGGFDSRRYLTDIAGPALAPAVVARAAVRAVGGARVVVVPGRARAIARLGTLAPSVTDRVIARGLDRELRRMAG